MYTICLFSPFDKIMLDTNHSFKNRKLSSARERKQAGKKERKEKEEKQQKKDKQTLLASCNLRYKRTSVGKDLKTIF